MEFGGHGRVGVIVVEAVVTDSRPEQEFAREKGKTAWRRGRIVGVRGRLQLLREGRGGASVRVGDGVRGAVPELCGGGG